MLERLEKFQAPPSWHHLIPAAIMLAIGLVACNLDFESAKIDEKVIAESKAKAEAPERVRALPFAHPLGCPEEDTNGRKLTATVSVIGERRPRCVYSAARK